MSSAWWRQGVFYQIYPRSFMDSNGDGVGDLRGIIDRLDHLEWLGVDGIWLNPTTPSPNDDWGYDVADYRGVDAELGTMDDLDELLRLTHERSIRVLLDLVPNHTSSAHPWFVDAASSRVARHRDWYVWADPAPDGGPPNNWISVFAGEPAWEWHEPTGQYYLHNFLASQPDLNWHNEEVHAEFRHILDFWFDKGVAGFRIDVAHALVTDEQLRDNPEATDKDPQQVQRIGQQQVYNMNRPETHDILREWRTISDSYEDARILVGETYVYEYEHLATYYGDLDELNLAFNFPFIFCPFKAAELKDGVEKTVAALPRDATPVWTASNHDTVRFPTRWCDGDTDLVRCALMMLLTLPGASFLYYGDEIGMTDVPMAYEDLKDPVGKRHWPKEMGRDPMRTPMQWTPEGTGGFTDEGVTPWLPMGDTAKANVSDQRQEAGSILHLTRDLIALRKQTPDLASGDYRTLSCDDDCWVWQRGDSIAVALNLGREPITLEPQGRILLHTHGERGNGDGPMALQPHHGAVVTLHSIADHDAKGEAPKWV